MPAKEHSSTETHTVRCYAIRRVNPFLGVLQVIETIAGRAVTANGVVWDIEVRAERGGGWGSLNQNSRQVAYYRYGLWSLADGLVNRPLAPHLDNDPYTQQCHELIECIRNNLEKLPFKLEDKLELWLYDKNNQQPLALLATSIPDQALPSPEPKYWSACIGAKGVPSQYRYPAARELEALVKQRAGFNIHKHWIIRQDDGSGITKTDHSQIKADILPAFLISEEWPEVEQSKLAEEYIAWIAPSLLTLQHLSRNQREHLENCLTIQAVSVEHHCHLYPEVINDQCLTAARVQCRLQKTN